MSGLSIALTAESPELLEQAQKLSCRLGLPLKAHLQDADLQLLLSTQRLELKPLDKRNAGSVYVDFVDGKSAHRRRFGGGRGQPLARAIGLKQGRTPYVLDATAGLGRDAFVLASLGCSVLLLERSPIIAALLEDGLRRAAAVEEVMPVVRRMKLFNADACDYLSQLAEEHRPDVIYLDPMYPHRNRSALVKKEMRLLQQLLGSAKDEEALLKSARNAARYRVVVKRPGSAEWLAGGRPSMSIESPNTRYDVYVNRAFES